jgi:hypothetical protein
MIEYEDLPNWLKELWEINFSLARKAETFCEDIINKNKEDSENNKDKDMSITFYLKDGSSFDVKIKPEDHKKLFSLLGYEPYLCISNFVFLNNEIVGIKWKQT